jgi:hypothetical protein
MDNGNDKILWGIQATFSYNKIVNFIRIFSLYNGPL